VAPDMAIIVQAIIRSDTMVKVQNLEAVFHFILYEMRSALITLIGVLVKDGVMMLSRVFTAVHQEQDQAVEL
jgi:hypothetical protein